MDHDQGRPLGAKKRAGEGAQPHLSCPAMRPVRNTSLVGKPAYQPKAVAPTANASTHLPARVETLSAARVPLLQLPVLPTLHQVLPTVLGGGQGHFILQPGVPGRALVGQSQALLRAVTGTHFAVGLRIAQQRAQAVDQPAAQ